MSGVSSWAGASMRKRPSRYRNQSNSGHGRLVVTVTSSGPVAATVLMSFRRSAESGLLRYSSMFAHERRAVERRAVLELDAVTERDHPRV